MGRRKVFDAEQRHLHHTAHKLWRRFATVVMLKEQVRAAGDPQLQQLLTRVQKGEQDASDVELLNRACFEEGRWIPWESGITVVTPSNRNRWNLNVEAILSFQRQHNTLLRIFISEHKWKGGQPTEDEANSMLDQGDESGIPVPAVFMFVPNMPVVVNQNTHQGLKLVNGASYTAVEVVLDRKYPGHPAGILLASETTKDLHLVGMPPGLILLAPTSCKIERAKKRLWQWHDAVRKGL